MKFAILAGLLGFATISLQGSITSRKHLDLLAKVRELIEPRAMDTRPVTKQCLTEKNGVRSFTGTNSGIWIEDTLFFEAMGRPDQHWVSYDRDYVFPAGMCTSGHLEWVIPPQCERKRAANELRNMI